MTSKCLKMLWDTKGQYLSKPFYSKCAQNQKPTFGDSTSDIQLTILANNPFVCGLGGQTDKCMDIFQEGPPFCHQNAWLFRMPTNGQTIIFISSVGVIHCLLIFKRQKRQSSLSVWMARTRCHVSRFLIKYQTHETLKLLFCILCLVDTNNLAIIKKILLQKVVVVSVHYYFTKSHQN